MLDASCIQGSQEVDLQCMFSIPLLYRKLCAEGTDLLPEPQPYVPLMFEQGKTTKEKDDIKEVLLFLRDLLWAVFTTIPLFHPESRCPGKDKR